MTFREFVRLVGETRKAQTAYFRTPGYDNLVKSKKLERRVDETVRTLESGQEELFHGNSRWTSRYGRWLKSYHDCVVCKRNGKCAVDNGGEAGCGLFIPSYQRRDWRKPKKNTSFCNYIVPKKKL